MKNQSLWVSKKRNWDSFAVTAFWINRHGCACGCWTRIVDYCRWWPIRISPWRRPLSLLSLCRSGKCLSPKIRVCCSASGGGIVTLTMCCLGAVVQMGLASISGMLCPLTRDWETPHYKMQQFKTWPSLGHYVTWITITWPELRFCLRYRKWTKSFVNRSCVLCNWY